MAYRTTWIVKQGMMDRAMEVLGGVLGRGRHQGGPPPHWIEAGVYTPHHSPQELIFEEVWNDKAAHDAWWEEQGAGEDVWQPWSEAVKRSTGSYVWNVKRWPER